MRFQEARIKARSLGFSSWDEWEVSAKNKKLPRELPRFPNIEYASQWLGWRDWLGLGKNNFLKNLKIESKETQTDCHEESNR